MPADADDNFSGKRLVVFGCGYIGGEVARQAIARGMRVSALTRNSATAESLRAQGIEVHVADLASDAWHSKIGGTDFALNAVSSGGGGTEGYRRSYRDGMRSIAAWASGAEVARAFVYTSSTSVYPQDGGVRVDEQADVAGRDERATLLIETEQAVKEVRAKRSVILRLAGIYGPARVHLVEQVRTGEVSGSSEHHLNLIHRDDACAAIWSAFAASRLSEPDIFNVVDDAPTPKGIVVSWLAAQIGVPEPRFTGAPAVGRRAVTPDRVIVNQRAKQELGWSPRFPTFQEGYSNLLSLGKRDAS